MAAVFSRHRRLWLLGLVLYLLAWGVLPAIFPRLVAPVWVVTLWEVLEGLAIYALVLWVIYCIVRAVTMQVRFRRHRRRGVSAD
jgi:hypothetical protein